MACENWKTKLDAYLDGELGEHETQSLDAHVRTCPSCATDALDLVQWKQALRVTGKRFTPSAEFRRKIQAEIGSKAKPAWHFSWAWAAALAIVILFSTLYFARLRAQRSQVFSEIADLHVATLASSSPVDVVSSDRHTVKPWFQGRIPFSFDLPDLKDPDVSLIGGRMIYLEQAPGAHLIYRIRKHEISVLIFQDGSIKENLSRSSAPLQSSGFNLKTWSRNGLRYFVIGDAGASDIDSIARLFGNNG